MQLVRWALVLGGMFNCTMGTFFFSDALLHRFFQFARATELTLFSRSATLVFPSDPVHLLLIHGFGAAAWILGATLVYSARDPVRYLVFILFDGMGRLVFGSLMVIYVFRFSLMATILVFGLIELAFGIAYLGYVAVAAKERMNTNP